MDTNDTRDNRIVEENRKPGTVEWQLQYTSFDDPITLASHPLIRQLRSLAIEGYASKTVSCRARQLTLWLVWIRPATLPLISTAWVIMGVPAGDIWPAWGPFWEIPSRCR